MKLKCTQDNCDVMCGTKLVFLNILLTISNQTLKIFSSNVIFCIEYKQEVLLRLRISIEIFLCYESYNSG